jgi:hypothetical protein
MAAPRPARLPPPGDSHFTIHTNTQPRPGSSSSSFPTPSSAPLSPRPPSTRSASALPAMARSTSSSGVLPAQAHLTDRDRLIADWLDRHGVLTTAQLTAAFFTSPITAAHRLAKLHALGLVDRFHRPLPGGGFGPWHWVIGPLGADITAAARDEPPPTASALRRRHARLADSSHLAHRLGTNQFFIDLHRHARHSAGTAQLTLWWSERDSAHRFRRQIRADGHALWHEDDTTIGLFLEYDTAGAENLSRLVDKLRGYDELAGDGGPAYPVLFWLHAADREANLHRLLAARAPGPVPVATGIHTPGANPAGRVWRLAGDRQPGRRRLVELPSRHGAPGSVYNPHYDSLGLAE